MLIRARLWHGLKVSPVQQLQQLSGGTTDVLSAPPDRRALTHLCHWTIDFAVMHSSVRTPRRGYVRGAHRRDCITLPRHVLNVTIDTQMDT